MNNTRIIVHFEGGVHCQAAVRHWIRISTIGGFRCRFLAPGQTHLPSSLGVLEPPRNETREDNECWPSEGWGWINSERLITIHAIGIELLDSAPTSDSELLKFDRDVAQWRNLFHDWLSVMAEGATGGESRSYGTNWLSKEQNDQLTSASYYAGEIYEPRPVSLWEWEHVFAHSIEGDKPPLARKLLAQATRDAAREDNRNAVIHAATAVECALADALLATLCRTHTTEQANDKLDRNRMLGNRIKLAQQLGLRVPNDARTTLVDPRNAAIHTGRQVTQLECITAIRTASNIINELAPLPIHCQEPPIRYSTLEEEEEYNRERD